MRSTGNKEETRRRQVASVRDLRARKWNTKGKKRRKVLGSESEKRSDLRRAIGSRSRA